MFEKFKFTDRQLAIFYKSALNNFKIAKESKIPEVSFKFGYDCLVKLAIIVAAKGGLRVKSRAGHHAELIQKLAEILKDKKIVLVGNEWRTKRNNELYFGGLTFTVKEIKGYLGWLKDIFSRVEDLLGCNKKLF
jgi:hypothetical protein